MAKGTQLSPEVRERAVRLILEHRDSHDSQWAAIRSVAEKFGCSTETLQKWFRQGERDAGTRPGPGTEARARVRALARKVKQLCRANEILRQAFAYFALAELGHRGT
jgi:transposase